MKNFTIIVLLISLFVTGAQAQVNIETPGTGTHWNMDSILLYHPFQVSIETIDGESTYVFSVSSVIVNSTDTLSFSDVNIGFVDSTTVESNNAVVFLDNVKVIAAVDSIYDRMRFDSSLVVMNNTEIRNGAGVSMLSSRLEAYDCIFADIHKVGRNPSYGVSLFKSEGLFKRCTFTGSERAALGSGINAAAWAIVDSCTFEGNNTTNYNSPQINFADVREGKQTQITNSRIIDAASVKSGGIGFTNLSTTVSNVLISNNEISNNRYGITLLGGNYVASITNNLILENNIQGLPNLGGSGINLYGNESNVSYLAGNVIEGNLWGVTIQASKADEFIAPLVNMGKTDDEGLPFDVGQNVFINNMNSGTLYNVFNMNDDTIWAQENFWNTIVESEVEAGIFHVVDDSTLGPVIYLDFLTEDPRKTSIVEFTKGSLNSLSFYPNPVTAGSEVSLNKAFNKSIMYIFNVEGKILTKQPVSGDSFFVPYSINPQAAYILIRDASDGKIYSGKILVR